MIDEFRKQIQDRLDQLMAEVNKLRRALAALGGGERSAPAGPARRRTGARATDPSGAKAAGRRSTAGGAESRSRSAARAGSSSSGSLSSVKGATRRSTGQRSGTRAGQGQTRSAVLAALASGEAMTAGEVAAATGLGRASVSTTLSKLAKSGEVAKVDRGYSRAESSSAA
jgi:DNA-binding transcriptional ArsR family regulator